jgi:hypothetical protein
MPAASKAAKPTPTVRRAARAAAASAPTPDEIRERNRKLEEAGRKHERGAAAGDEPAHTGRGIVHLPGRLLSTGERKGARTVRRKTLYLPPDVAHELVTRAATRGLTESELASEALAEAFGIALEQAAGA